MSGLQGYSNPAADPTPASTVAAHADAPLRLANGLYPISCLTCAKRKVKCDRVQPCANCQKHKITCEYRDAAPKGRKRKAPASTEEKDARLEKYEGLLRGMGVDPTSVNSSEQQDNYPTPRSLDLSASLVPPATKRPAAAVKKEDDEHIPGRLVVHRGKTRYVEGNFWTSVTADVSLLREEVPLRLTLSLEC